MGEKTISADTDLSIRTKAFDRGLTRTRFFDGYGRRFRLALEFELQLWWFLEPVCKAQFLHRTLRQQFSGIE